MSDEGGVGGGSLGGDGGIETIERTCASLVRELRQKQTELAEREEKIKREEEEWRAKRQALDEERCVCWLKAALLGCAHGHVHVHALALDDARGRSPTRPLLL